MEKEAKHFPQILYKSTIVSAHSILESTLLRFRIETELNINVKIKFKHLKPLGNEIENILNYYFLVHHINFTEIDSQLELLKKYVYIRNTIVHQNGNISQLPIQNQSAIKNLIDSLNSIKIDTDFHLEFEENYITEYISFISKIGLLILEKIEIQK